MSPLTTHVLDTARGLPAEGVPVELEIAEDGAFRPLAAGRTDADGRLRDLLPPGGLRAAVYRLRFDVDAYHAALGVRGFFPVAELIFRVDEPERHHHVPLLLSPFGYTTYRGS
jgi:5-hydroxyisourate hydrolase